MNAVKAADQVIIFSRYIGQQVVIQNLPGYDDEIVALLTGIKHNALLVEIEDTTRWITLSDRFKLCEIRLLLKPLKKLTNAVINTANSLPVKAFITPYYQSQGFDMPVFIAPGHPCNGKYVNELGLADYRTTAEIYKENTRFIVLMANDR